MGSGIIFNNGGGGGGTTINPSNNFIPVRSNATTFVDSSIYNDNISLSTIINGQYLGISLQQDIRQFIFGDYNGDNNNTIINVNDPNKYIFFNANPINFLIDGLNNVSKFNYNGNDIGLKLDFANGQYYFGDYNGYVNFTYINVDDANVGIRLTSQGFVYIGDTDNNHNGTYLSLDDNSQIIKTLHQANDIGLKLDFANDLYFLGDYNGLSNSTQVTIDNNNSNITLWAENSLQFKGVGLQSATAGGSSGEHLVIYLNGTQYKIALLNP